MKEQKGITLIALVITIIVLLILAGVTIAMLTGDNSAPAKATEAAQKDAISGVKDDIAMRVNEALLNYYNTTYVTNGSNGTADSLSSVNTAISNAVSANSSNANIESITYTTQAAKPNTDGSIVITTKGFTCTGTVKPTGSISWGAISARSGS